MGLFDKIKDAMEKKECVFCGKEIGLLGKKKLEDGVTCKDCVALLSPWFTDRKNSTVAEIDQQLAYREENRKNLESFNGTAEYGEDAEIFIVDEPNRRFIVLPRRNTDVARYNPDILSFDDITEMKLDISYHSTEEKRRNSDGQQVSYVPPHFEHSFDFYLNIETRHPYAHKHRAHLNGRTLKVHTLGPKMERSYRLDALEDLRRFLDYYPPRTQHDQYVAEKEMEDCYYFADMGDAICRAIMRG